MREQEAAELFACAVNEWGRPGLRRWLHRRAHDGPWLRAPGAPDGACRRSAKPIAHSISRHRRRAETGAGSRLIGVTRSGYPCGTVDPPGNFPMPALLEIHAGTYGII